MSSIRSTILSTLTFGLLVARSIEAQTNSKATQAQIEACSASITYPSYEDPYTMYTNETASFTMTMNYDYSKCNGIPFASASLRDTYTGNSYRCTYAQFSSAQTYVSTCTVTRGTMAQSAVDNGDHDFDYNIQMGYRPTYYARDDYFGVVGVYVPPTATSTTSATTATQTTTPSGVNARKRRAAIPNNQQHLAVENAGMMCEAGHTSCPLAGRKGTVIHKCLDTSRNLFACGGCPGMEGSQDCSEISGVANVQCVTGVCLIKACDRNHKLSADGTSCIPKEAYPIKRNRIY